MKNDLPWMAEARRHIGLTEIPGRQTHNKTLLAMLADMGKYSSESRAWWDDDETPWCGLFVGHTLGVAGRHVIKDWYRAAAWAGAGLTKLDKPAYGCIVTFTRQGGGHVGFVAGEDKNGHLLVLGGNQSNRVSIAAFPKSRATGYFWPSKWANGKAVPSAPSPERYTLPKGAAAVSRSEA